MKRTIFIVLSMILASRVAIADIYQEIEQLKKQIITTEDQRYSSHEVNLVIRVIHRNLLDTFVNPKSSENLVVRGKMFGKNSKDFYRKVDAIVLKYSGYKQWNETELDARIRELNKDLQQLEDEKLSLYDQLDGLSYYAGNLQLILKNQQLLVDGYQYRIKNQQIIAFIKQVNVDLQYWFEYSVKFSNQLDVARETYAKVISYLYVGLPKQLEMARLAKVAGGLVDAKQKIQDMMAVDKLYADAKFLMQAYQSDSQLFSAKVETYDYLSALDAIRVYMQKIDPLYQKFNQLQAKSSLSLPGVVLEMKTIRDAINSDYVRISSQGWINMSQKQLLAVKKAIEKKAFNQPKCEQLYQKFLKQFSVSANYDAYERQTNAFVYLRNHCMAPK